MVGVCALSMFLVGLDTTIVNIALPSIGSDLGVGTRELEWVVDAYTLVLASALISAGALADRLGRRSVFRCGLVVFTIGSVACALAPTAGVLIGARVLQGIGASMLSPVALAIVVNVMTDARERARAIGVWASVFGLSMAAGPATGGALVAAFGWRSVFWVVVPIVAVALALGYVVLPESRAANPRRLDVPGQVLLTVAIFASVATLIEGPHLGWSSTPVLVLAASGVLAAVVFVLVERRREQPLIEPGLFRRIPFVAAVAGAVAVFVALSVVLLLNTMYLQDELGWSPLAAGSGDAAPCRRRHRVRSAVRNPGGPQRGTTPAVAGGIVRRRRWRRPRPRGATVPIILVGYAFVGVGFGFANAPITNTAVQGLSPARAGVAGAITSTARQFGSAIGIALAGALLVGTPDLTTGWLVTAACGLVLIAVSRTATTRS